MASGAGTADLVTVGTLTANGDNMKFDIWVTAKDNAVDTNVVSAQIQQTAYRSAGVVTLLTANASNQQGNGTMNTDVTFSLVVSSNDVILRATNTSSTATYVINSAVSGERQLGGASS